MALLIAQQTCNHPLGLYLQIFPSPEKRKEEWLNFVLSSALAHLFYMSIANPWCSPPHGNHCLATGLLVHPFLEWSLLSQSQCLLSIPKGLAVPQLCKFVQLLLDYGLQLFLFLEEAKLLFTSFECSKWIWTALAAVAQWIESWPVNQRVASWIPSLGHMPGLWARSAVGDTWEATTKWSFSPSSLAPSLSLKINK